jgi:hypothetical protein
MKALFLGHFAATVAPRILAKVKTPLESSILDDERDAEHLAPLLAEANGAGFRMPARRNTAQRNPGTRTHQPSLLAGKQNGGGAIRKFA